MKGVLGKFHPDDDHRDDIAAAFKIVRSWERWMSAKPPLSAKAWRWRSEAAEGTDKMIARVANAARSLAWHA